jgi:uncharacterized protein YqgC (DUF456 family)
MRHDGYCGRSACRLRAVSPATRQPICCGLVAIEETGLEIALYALAAVLIVGGLVGNILPALPGIPMIFGGIWLAAAVDEYRHLGLWWLLIIGALGALGVTVDFVSASLGAKRVGASKLAMSGAALGTLVGMFFGLAGLLLGPFIGALLGELLSGASVLRSTHVGAATWIGLLFGTLAKLALSFMMIGLFGFAWLVG